MRVAVLYNQPLSGPFHEAEEGVLDQVRTIVDALSDAGHSSSSHVIDGGQALHDFLAQPPPELVFNCCESIEGHSHLEMNVAATLELFKVPFTGSSALTLGLALDKALTKAVLTASAIATAPYLVFAPFDALFTHQLCFPLIVKPNAEDASIGIDEGAIVHTHDSLRDRVNFVWESFQQPALVEEYIDGREFNVSLLSTSNDELAVLPIGEILFDVLPTGLPRIVSYKAKWSPGSPEYRGTVSVCPAALPTEMSKRIGQTALAAARALGLRSYGRVDLRFRERDQALFVIEINPNPDLGPDAGFMRAARASGRTIQDTILEIVEQALRRRRDTAA